MRALRYGFGMASILVLASLLAVVFGHVRVNILPKVLAHENQQETCSVELLEGSFSYAVQALTLFPPPTSPPRAPVKSELTRPLPSGAPFTSMAKETCAEPT